MRPLWRDRHTERIGSEPKGIPGRKFYHIRSSQGVFPEMNMNIQDGKPFAKHIPPRKQRERERRAVHLIFVSLSLMFYCLTQVAWPRLTSKDKEVKSCYVLGRNTEKPKTPLQESVSPSPDSAVQLSMGTQDQANVFNCSDPVPPPGLAHLCKPPLLSLHVPSTPTSPLQYA